MAESFSDIVIKRPDVFWLVQPNGEPVVGGANPTKWGPVVFRDEQDADAYRRTHEYCSLARIERVTAGTLISLRRTIWTYDAQRDWWTPHDWPPRFDDSR